MGVLTDAKEIINKHNNIKSTRLFGTFPTIPKEIIYERKELSKLAIPLAQFLTIGTVTHMLLQGSKGSGKTTLIKYLLIEAKEMHSKLGVYHINCRVHNTSYKVIKELLNLKTNNSIKLARSYCVAISTFKKYFNKKQNSIIVFDEVDLMLDDNIFYLITRESTNIYMIMITNKTKFYRDVLSSDVKSSLDYKFFYFKKYETAEIKEILGLRAKQGLFKHDPFVIDTIAEVNCWQFNSDVRLGISTMKEVFSDNTFKEGDASSVYGIMKQEEIKQKNEQVRDLQDIHLLLLWLTHTYKYSNRIFQTLGDQGLHYSKNRFFKLMCEVEKLELVYGTKTRAGRSYIIEYAIELATPTLMLVKELLIEKHLYPGQEEDGVGLPVGEGQIQ